MATINEKAAFELINAINNNFSNIYNNHHRGFLLKYLSSCIDDTTKSLLKDVIDEMYSFMVNNDEPEELYIEGDYCGRWKIKKFDITSFYNYYMENKETLNYTLSMLESYVQKELEEALQICSKEYNDVIIDVEDEFKNQVFEISMEAK